LNIWKKYLK